VKEPAPQLAATALADLGWGPGRDTEFASFLATGLVPGRVCLEHNHVYRVMTASGEWLAEASGRIKHLASGRRELPAVGDWVAVRPVTHGGHAAIRAILSRHTSFSRRAAGRETEEQVIAANIDTVLVVFGLDSKVKPRAIERYLSLARQGGVRPVVVLNKADVSPDPAGAVREVEAVAGGAPVHAVNAKGPAGVAVLEQYVAPGQTLALLGPSGVGKSTIVNRLLGEERLATGDVREWDARGRHTSVHRQLVVRPAGGLIVDTPGMRELQLWESDEALDETFSELVTLGLECRFRDCQHDREPGCAVKAAVESGAVAPDRYQSYLKLRAERQATEKLRDERAMHEAKRAAKQIGKSLRAMQKLRGR
jgi:ribosome biogenesis GTPase